MSYVTSVERIGVEKGIQQGTLQSLLRILEKKFGSVSNDIKSNLQQADEEQLLLWLEQTLTANSIGEVFGN